MVPKDVAANTSFPTLQLGCTEGSAPVAAGIALAEARSEIGFTWIYHLVHPG